MNRPGEGRTHGTISCYMHGCRCVQCMDAAAEKIRRSRQNRWERLGTPRPHRCPCGSSFPSQCGLTSHQSKVHGYYC